MKDKIIHKAFYDVYYFNHFEELNIALDSYSPIIREHEELVLQGLYFILVEIGYVRSLQRQTLIQTMNNVRKEYGRLHCNRHTAEQISAVTMAIVHVRMVNDGKRMLAKQGLSAW